MSLKPKHLLIVDDEPDIRYIYELKFNKLGYRVSVAATALQAKQKLSAKNNFDLVISDLKMPKMDGVELFNFIQSYNPDIPFILITGHAKKESMMKAVKDGITNILIKPVRHQDIIEKVNDLLTAGQPKEIPKDKSA